MKILVIGDAMLDLSRYGTCVRKSPEARGCWVFQESRREWTLGGAANVARWLAADSNLEVTLASPHGRDATSGILREQCQRWAVRLSPRMFDPALAVTVKERFIVEDAEKERCQQLLRADNDMVGELRATDLPPLEHDLCHGHYDAVVIVDYDKFVFRGEVGRDLIRTVGKLDLPVIVNSKTPSRWQYMPTTALICNHEEMTSLGVHDVRRARQEVLAQQLIVTQGAGGVTAIPKDGDPIHRLVQTGAVLDVTGAGDAFTAGFVQAALRRSHRGLQRLKPVELVDLLDEGQRFAAHCCSQVGCGNPLVASEAAND